MRHHMRFFSGIVLIALVLVLGMGNLMAQTTDTGLVRFVHVIPGVSAVDIYTDGQLTVKDLSYGQATGYIQVAAGAHTITVTFPGVTTVLWQQQIDIADAPLTLIASSIDPFQFVPYADEFAPLEISRTRFQLIHAISNGPVVDFYANGQLIGPGLQSGDLLTSIDVNNGVYEFAAAVAGQDLNSPLIGPTLVGLVGGTSQMFVVYGTPNRPNLLILNAAVPSDGSDALVRVTHTVAGAPEVDVYIDDTLVVPGLGFGEYTEHLPVAARDYVVELRQAGTDNSLVQAILTLEANSALTVAAMGTPEELIVGAFADDISGVTSERAVLSVINTIPGNSSVTVELGDGTLVADALPFGEASSPVTLDASTQTPTVTFSLDGQSATVDLDMLNLYGGVYYNVFALTATTFTPPTLVFAPTGVSQGTASAPGASQIVVAPVEPEEIAPVEEETSSEVVAAQPTEAPQTTEVTQPVQTPVVTTSTAFDGPTARVVLNPDANLQLRLRPSREEQSLGLAPSGSILLVLGREGAPVDANGEEIIAEGEEAWVDPATLLEDERADLDPVATWLYIIYNTPDGGSITAWVNAQVLDLREANGDRMRLADLETIPNNRAGVVSDTSVTPPAPPQNRVTLQVINLNPGTNLRIRRTPGTTGEDLAGVPNGTILEFLGLGQSEQWAFIRYLPPEGGSITGWVFTQYVTYQLNGQPVTIETLRLRNLFPSADEETQRGDRSADAPTSAAPTPDPLRNVYVADVQINQNANLNLRLRPNSQASVCVQIPSGSRLVVDGRTEDGEWLRTTFENAVGWVASAFVQLTFNNLTAEVNDIPVIPQATIDAGPNDC